MDSCSLRGAEAAHHFAAVIRNQYDAFWQRDVAVLLADLNADVTKTLAIFGLNTQAATAVNAMLDAIDDPRWPTRAPAAMPEGFSFDQQAGTFGYVAPESEPEP